MKFKKVESLLKSKKTIIICQGPDCQWIGDGQAFYPCYEFPVLDEVTLPVLFDIPVDKRDTYTVLIKGLPKNFSFMDTVKDECPINRGVFDFLIEGTRLEPVETSQGMVLIGKKYLVPYSDEKEGIQLYERASTTGAPYIAVKKGFMLVGIIKPINIIDEKFISTMENIVNSSKIALKNALTKTNFIHDNVYE